MTEHLYLHFPFCTGRCAYCAFVSGPPPRDIPTVIGALLREKETRGIPLLPLETLYCGGGTPALIGPEGFRRLAGSGLFTLRDGAEWTVELHPAAVTPELADTLAGLGVNRLSLGVQSFDDATLLRCNRRHTAAMALEAVRICRERIPDTGIDLIAALPGVTSAEWERTLETTLALALPHISVYTLSVEEGSLWHRQGMEPPEPDAACDAMLTAANRLRRAGYERYETSNFAQPGFRCRHNLNTWHGGDYLGLGRGACSRLGRTRTDGTGHAEILDAVDDALERVLTGLRLSEGFSPERAVAAYPVLAPWRDGWKACLDTFRRQGLLDARNAPTDRGYEVLDALVRELLSRPE